MKIKIILLLIIYCFLISCGVGTDKDKCLQSVEQIFPKSKIYKDPDLNYTFYVVDSTGLRKVTTLNFTNSDISGVTDFYLVRSNKITIK